MKSCQTASALPSDKPKDIRICFRQNWYIILRTSELNKKHNNANTNGITDDGENEEALNDEVEVMSVCKSSLTRVSFPVRL